MKEYFKVVCGRVLAAIVVLTVLFGCRHTLVLETGFEPEAVAETPLLLPSDSLDPIYHGLRRDRLVKKFYSGRNYSPVWADSEHLFSDSLFGFISNVRFYGLLPVHYHLGELTFLKNLKMPSRSDILRRDVLMTDAFFSLAQHLKSGRLANGETAWDSLSISLLEKAVIDGQFRKHLEKQEPQFSGYRSLREALQRLINTTDIRERQLLLEGRVVDSLQLHRKIRSIEINLERWRGEKDALGERYIFVNIPSFMVRVLVNDEEVLESRAIVGRPKTPTPEFSSTVQCFVTYPYWHVPRTISVRDILPAIQKDANYISRNNFDVLDRRGKVLNPDSLEWQKFHKDYFPVILRQREGAENSLGVIKFVFDNPFAVLLHDTNAPRLFSHKERALSNGCVRMEKAIDLAHFLVTGKRGEKSPVITRYLDEKLRHTVELNRSIPIHLRYFTAEVRDGELYFYDDIYNNDSVLLDVFYAMPQGGYY